MPDIRFLESEPRIHPTAELKSCKLGRYAAIGERVILRDVELGDFSYFERHAEAIYSRIGKFCSIAANTRINALEHPIERATSHKVTYRPNEYFRYLGVDGVFLERRRSKKVVVGNDVWIGHGAVILPGITVGNGAVVGANAVVTADVPAYQIVAGAPARIVRPRFEDDMAQRLEKLGWWDWPVETLYEALPDMQAMTAEAFVDRWETRTAGVKVKP